MDADQTHKDRLGWI